jgi:predicted regulator of Ras-like GTPase activity (Roadblock/LC7/MglB family)
VKSDGVMFKPFSADMLVQKVQELLAARVDRGAESGVVPATGFGALAQLANVPGILWALVVDREGFVIETAGEVTSDADVAGALTSCLREATDGIGRELGQGALQGMILEYEKTMLLIHPLEHLVLVVSVGDSSALGKARYYVKKALPELGRAAVSG